MNTVEALIETPFSTLPLAEKLKIKEMGPHTPPLKMQVVARDRGRVYTRRFSEEWYRRKTWLCGSIPKDALFCFPCLLFGGENLWTRIGMRDLKHFTQKMTKHEQSKKHLDNAMKLCVLGKANIAAQLDEGYRTSVIKHNQEVDNNRYILARIIDSIRLCAATESPLRGHDESEDSLNPGMFRRIIDFAASLNAALQLHLQEATVFRGLSKTIQNELLECMLIVARNHIKDEVKRTSFVAIEADDTTDFSTYCQNVLIFRYITDDGTPVERFYSFTQLKDARAETIAATLLQQLEEVVPDKEKLIAQSYDGASVMRGERGGVRRKIQDVYPHAHYIHCFAHQLNLVMKNASSLRKEVRIFFQNIIAFPTFFSLSAKRTDALMQLVKRRIPHASQTRWNFQIRTISVIAEKRLELIECFDAIGGKHDAKTGFDTQAFLKLLRDDKEFLYFLSFFNRIMPHVDILYHQLQRRVTDPVLVQTAIRDFENVISTTKSSIGTLFEDLPPDTFLHRTQSKEKLDQIAAEVCDLIIRETHERFSFTGHLSSARLLDPSLFHTHSRSFPEESLHSVMQAYPMLEKDRLKNELTAMYERQELYSAKGALDIFKLLLENNMQTSFEQLVKLLQIAITMPMTTAEAERSFSALKRVKTFLRSTMSEERLNALSMLTVEEQMINSIPQFNTEVIEVFAAQKERRAKFIYKK